MIAWHEGPSETPEIFPVLVDTGHVEANFWKCKRFHHHLWPGGRILLDNYKSLLHDRLIMEWSKNSFQGMKCFTISN